MIAFTAKKALLDRIAKAEGEEGWTLPAFSTPPADIAAFSLEYGLHPAFVNLLIAIGGIDLGFWRQVIEGLPSGADSRLLVTRWIGWLWTDPEHGLRSKIADEKLKAGGDLILDLQERAASGEDISKSQWRSARSALANAATSDEVETAAAAGAAAAGWDLESVPGAAADMIYAWKGTFFAEIDRDLGWNDEKEAAANQRREKIHSAGLAYADSDAARSEASAAEGAAKDEASMARYREQYQKGVQDYVAANPSDLDRRDELRNASYLEMYRLGREGLLRQIGQLGDGRPESAVA